MSKPNMLARITQALPKRELEQLARAYGVERPWNAERQMLVMLVVSKDSQELREEIVDIVRRTLLP